MGQRWDRALKAFKIKGLREADALRIHLYGYNERKFDLWQQKRSSNTVLLDLLTIYLDYSNVSPMEKVW